MKTLLRGDLYRASKLRGNIFWYVVILLVIVLGNVFFAVLLGNDLNDYFAQSAQSAESTTSATLDMFANFSSPSNFLGKSLLSFGLLTMLVCWATTNFCWVEIRDGFTKNIITSTGKQTYYLSKILFALCVSVIFVVIGVVVALVCGQLFVGFKSFDSPVHILVWSLLLILLSWACASLCLVILWLLKNQVIAYVLGLCLATGFLSSLVANVFLFIPSADMFADMYSELVNWLPTTAISMLSSATRDTVDILGGAPKELASVALNAEVIVHVIVTSVVMLALSVVLTLTAVRKRDR